MQAFDDIRYITLEVQNTFFEERINIYRRWLPVELFFVDGGAFDRKEENRNIYLAASELHHSDRNIVYNMFMRRRYSSRKCILFPLRFFFDERTAYLMISGLINLNTTTLFLPFLKYANMVLFVEGKYSSERDIYLYKIDEFYDKIWIKIQRKIAAQTNETDILLPKHEYAEVDMFVDIGYGSDRWCLFPLTYNNERDISFLIKTEASLNETDILLPFISYSTIPIYLSSDCHSERDIFIKLARVFSDKYIVMVPFDTYLKEQRCWIQIKRGISVNETDLMLAELEWADRFIVMPNFVYNSEKRLFIPTTIQYEFISRSPIDISMNKKDLDKVIDGLFHSGIESLIIKDENDNILVSITEYDYEQGKVKTKIKNIFPEDKDIVRLKFEIFTSQGKQLDGLPVRLSFKGFAKGAIS